jgi:tripartite-type tricarboxylate transporter receptor subunit TctC
MLVLGFVFSLAVTLRSSEDYPTRPMRMIEPFGAGGGPDLIARSVSQKLSEFWGSQ